MDPKTLSIAKVNASTFLRYTYGQPVPGAALVQVCRNFRRNYLSDNAPMISPCLVETVVVSNQHYINHVLSL